MKPSNWHFARRETFCNKGNSRRLWQRGHWDVWRNGLHHPHLASPFGARCA